MGSLFDKPFGKASQRTCWYTEIIVILYSLYVVIKKWWTQ